MRSSIVLFAGLTLFGQTPQPGATESAPVQLNVAHQPSFGPANAAVTIVEFGDFECPSCRAEAPLLRELIPKLFPNKVRIVFKDYPLESIHPWARAASIAGRCVFRQNAQAFWKFYDWDYQNQDDTTVENLKSRVLAWAAGMVFSSSSNWRVVSTRGHHGRGSHAEHRRGKDGRGAGYPDAVREWC